MSELCMRCLAAADGQSIANRTNRRASSLIPLGFDTRCDRASHLNPTPGGKKRRIMSDKKNKKKKEPIGPSKSNPAIRFYEPNNDYGIQAYWPPPEYSDRILETQLREHPPWPYLPHRPTDPTHRRQLVDAERCVRKRLGFTRADQLAVERSVGAARCLNVNLRNEPEEARARAIADTSLSQDLHRISEEYDDAVLDAVLETRRRDRRIKVTAMPTNEYHGKSARAIAGKLMMESVRNLCQDRSANALGLERCQTDGELVRRTRVLEIEEAAEQERVQTLVEERQILNSFDGLKHDLRSMKLKAGEFIEGTSKQTAIEIEQLSARVVEAETKLKTEVTRIKKKMQMTITELEMSLDVANRNNLELQKTIKKQSLQLTELQAHYDETQRQLAVTLDQYGIAQRRLQSMTSELEEVRANYEQALRSKRMAEQMYEEAQSRINELTTINVNLSGARSKLEQELGALAGDYEEVTKELRSSDERYQRVQVELKHTVEILHEEQERVIKIETIKKSLEIEVKNLSVRLEEVEANAIVGGKRIISKLEARMRDLELELEEEKRRHAETIKILRKKERHVKEVLIQNEEDQKNIVLLQEMLDKTSQKVNIYKRQLTEQEGMSQQSVTRSRRFQRELEAAEDRAENAESNLSLIRAKHRTFVTTSSVPGSQVYMVQETRSSSEAF